MKCETAIITGNTRFKPTGNGTSRMSRCRVSYFNNANFNIYSMGQGVKRLRKALYLNGFKIYKFKALDT